MAVKQGERGSGAEAACKQGERGPGAAAARVRLSQPPGGDTSDRSSDQSALAVAASLSVCVSLSLLYLSVLRY